MKYNIISINNDRAEYKKNIRINAIGFKEVKMVSIDGSAGSIDQLIKAYGLKWTDWKPSFGEVGIWLSNYIRWHAVSTTNEPLIVFEDDAIIHESFVNDCTDLLSQLPDDWDFVALWVPDNQRIDYRYNLEYNKDGEPQIYGMRPEGLPSYFDCGAQDVARVYQGYGMVATLYSPQGGRKLIDLARKNGIYTPVDCFLMQQAHKGALNGYAPKPDKVFVDYDYPETQIHNTDKVN